MARHLDGGMFGIKMIHPNHLKEPYWKDGRPSVMNFSSKGNVPAIARNIPVGHRSLGYLYGPGCQKFVWAFEYTGTVEQGRAAAIAYGIPLRSDIFRPIRSLQTVAPESVPIAQEICQRIGFDFTPNHYTMRYIAAKDYQAIFDAIWPKKAV